MHSGDKAIPEYMRRVLIWHTNGVSSLPAPCSLTLLPNTQTQGEYAAGRRVCVCNSRRGFLFIYKLRRTSAGRSGKKRLPALSRSLIVCGNNDHSRTALLCPVHTCTSFAFAAAAQHTPRENSTQLASNVLVALKTRTVVESLSFEG